MGVQSQLLREGAHSSAVGGEPSPFPFLRRESLPAWVFGLQGLHDTLTMAWGLAEM